ncbi:MAG: MBL fold metallo-hydrolase [Deltaproteobacteria bacterium HGW-Deltaproteobacteria-10]|nr:MAG: MBL fold metallo-hydrolase [Deltaproteobacteria bacterium HGW-Deltaproteobacteria-10]
MEKVILKTVDKVEILTLQDNYIDITAMDNNAVVTRAMPIKDGQIKVSIGAEHGFSAIVKATTGDQTKTLLFDFGFSADGAAHNAAALDVDMTQVEAVVLSHGHSDHTGGMEKLAAMIGRKNVPLIVHPGVFQSPRYMKFSEEFKIYFPEFTREMVSKAGLNIMETKEPFLLLGNNCLFLGEVPKRSDFEKGIPMAHFLEGGVEKHDAIADDTSIVMHLKGKGLVILSGCAHAGIINTVTYAREITGIDKIHAIMGGFHLSGPLFEPIADRTIAELKKMAPRYIIPVHCTGRKAIINMEKEMPEQFILNMSGTKLTFA